MSSPYCRANRGIRNGLSVFEFALRTVAENGKHVLLSGRSMLSARKWFADFP